MGTIVYMSIYDVTKFGVIYGWSRFNKKSIIVWRLWGNVTPIFVCRFRIARN